MGSYHYRSYVPLFPQHVLLSCGALITYSPSIVGYPVSRIIHFHSLYLSNMLFYWKHKTEWRHQLSINNLSCMYVCACICEYMCVCMCTPTLRYYNMNVEIREKWILILFEILVLFSVLQNSAGILSPVSNFHFIIGVLRLQICITTSNFVYALGKGFEFVSSCIQNKPSSYWLISSERRPVLCIWHTLLGYLCSLCEFYMHDYWYPAGFWFHITCSQFFLTAEWCKAQKICWKVPPLSVFSERDLAASKIAFSYMIVWVKPSLWTFPSLVSADSEVTTLCSYVSVLASYFTSFLFANNLFIFPLRQIHVKRWCLWYSHFIFLLSVRSEVVSSVLFMSTNFVFSF